MQHSLNFIFYCTIISWFKCSSSGGHALFECERFSYSYNGCYWGLNMTRWDSELPLCLSVNRFTGRCSHMTFKETLYMLLSLNIYIYMWPVNSRVQQFVGCNVILLSSKENLLIFNCKEYLMDVKKEDLLCCMDYKANMWLMGWRVIKIMNIINKRVKILLWVKKNRHTFIN